MRSNDGVTLLGSSTLLASPNANGKRSSANVEGPASGSSSIYREPNEGDRLPYSDRYPEVSVAVEVMPLMEDLVALLSTVALLSLRLWEDVLDIASLVPVLAVLCLVIEGVVVVLNDIESPLFFISSQKSPNRRDLPRSSLIKQREASHRRIWSGMSSTEKLSGFFCGTTPLMTLRMSVGLGLGIVVDSPGVCNVACVRSIV